MKYAFVGSHGTGKSSAAHFLAAKLKKQNPTLSVKVLEESVRITNKLVGMNNTSFQKLSILDSLYKQELFKSVYNVIICDRVSFDYIVYGEYFNIQLSEAYKELCIENIQSFDDVYLVRPDSTPIASDGFRMTDTKQRDEIDILFYDMLNLYKVPFKEIRTGDVFK